MRKLRGCTVVASLCHLRWLPKLFNKIEKYIVCSGGVKGGQGGANAPQKLLFTPPPPILPPRPLLPFKKSAEIISR